MIRRVLRTPAVALLAAVTAGQPAAAQRAGVGDRVRVLTPTVELRGELTATVPDSLLVRPDGHRAVRAVCTCDLTGLEVSTGQTLLWLPLGVLGAAAGAVAAQPLVDSGLVDDPGYLLTGVWLTAALILVPLYPFVDEDQVTPLIGGVIGGALGVGIGMYAGRDGWREVGRPYTPSPAAVPGSRDGPPRTPGGTR